MQCAKWYSSNRPQFLLRVKIFLLRVQFTNCALKRFYIQLNCRDIFLNEFSIAQDVKNWFKPQWPQSKITFSIVFDCIAPAIFHNCEFFAQTRQCFINSLHNFRFFMFCGFMLRKRFFCYIYDYPNATVRKNGI